MKSIEEKVLRIVREQADASQSEVMPETELAQLGMDSMSRVEIAVKLETEFHCLVSDTAMEEWVKVGDIVKTIRMATES